MHMHDYAKWLNDWDFKFPPPPPLPHHQIPLCIETTVQETKTGDSKNFFSTYSQSTNNFKQKEGLNLHV